MRITNWVRTCSQSPAAVMQAAAAKLQRLQQLAASAPAPKDPVPVRGKLEPP